MAKLHNSTDTEQPFKTVTADFMTAEDQNAVEPTLQTANGGQLVTWSFAFTKTVFQGQKQNKGIFK